MTKLETIQKYKNVVEHASSSLGPGVTAGDLNDDLQLFQIDFLAEGVKNVDLRLPIYLSGDMVKQIAPTFIKKPITINHANVNQSNITREEVGRVVEIGERKNANNEHVAFAKIYIDKRHPRGQEACRLLNDGWRASCEYEVLKDHVEMIDNKKCLVIDMAQGLAISIVEDPRYQQVEVKKVINSNKKCMSDHDTNEMVSVNLVEKMLNMLNPSSWKVKNSEGSGKDTKKEEEEAAIVKNAEEESSKKQLHETIRSVCEEVFKELMEKHVKNSESEKEAKEKTDAEKKEEAKEEADEKEVVENKKVKNSLGSVRDKMLSDMKDIIQSSSANSFENSISRGHALLENEVF